MRLPFYYPDTVKVHGKKYKINSNFRIAQTIEAAMTDESLDDGHKVYETLKAFYGDNVPLQYPDEAVSELMRFYVSGMNPKYRPIQQGAETGARTDLSQLYYSYVDDYYLINRSFIQQYNIDLDKVDYLHYWKFCDMFKRLKNDTPFIRELEYRIRKRQEQS